MAKRTLTRRRMMKKLPEEMIQEILSRLPLVSLFKSRYTCRSWHSLIKDPGFCKLHYSQSSQNPIPNSLILFSQSKVYYIPDVELTYDQKPIKLNNLPMESKSGNFLILGSLNGFICFVDTIAGNPKFIICNPVSGDWINISANTDKTRIYFFCYGFGYSTIAQEYKLILLCYCLKQKTWKVAILTLGSNTWRSIGFITRKISHMQKDGIFVNGSLHWLTCDCNYKAADIIACNVEDERFRVLHIPDSIKGKKEQSKLLLGQFEGHLIIVDHTRKHSHVWIMKEYGVKESWVRLFVIPRDSMLYGILPMGMQKDGNLLLKLLAVGTLYNALSSYDPRTKTHKELRFDCFPNFFQVVPHVGTLVKLNDVVAMEGL